MVVEDEASDFLLLRRALEKEWAGAPVLWMRDGIYAIEYLSGLGHYIDRQKYPLPTVIVLDLNLPRLGGLELLEWISREPSTSRVPVVVLSGSADLSDESRAYALGAYAYYAKPGTLTGLDALVRSVRFVCEKRIENSVKQGGDAQ